MGFAAFASVFKRFQSVCVLGSVGSYQRSDSSHDVMLNSIATFAWFTPPVASAASSGQNTRSTGRPRRRATCDVEPELVPFLRPPA
jgi:hypothetical protein